MIVTKIEKTMIDTRKPPVLLGNSEENVKFTNNNSVLCVPGAVITQKCHTNLTAVLRGGCFGSQRQK
jgi:hypothetical protein